MKFLVVDDDPMLRKVLTKHLSSYTDDIDIAADGKEAIDAYSKALREGQPYVLICLDVDMPKINGNGVLNFIRKTEQAKGLRGDEKTKILMTTAVSDRERVLKIIKSGCNGYLLKPYNQDRLNGELKKLGFHFGEAV